MLAGVAGPAGLTETRPLGTPAAPVAVWHNALVDRDLALDTLPAVLAMAAAAAVHAVAGAQQGADA